MPPFRRLISKFLHCPGAKAVVKTKQQQSADSRFMKGGETTS